MRDEIFTIDNLWHSLVAIGWVCVSLNCLWFMDTVPNWLPPMLATSGAVGLYLREASQVGWKWSLPDKHTGQPSLHKHMEWIVGTCAGFIASIVITVLT